MNHHQTHQMAISAMPKLYLVFRLRMNIAMIVESVIYKIFLISSYRLDIPGLENVRMLI